MTALLDSIASFYRGRRVLVTGHTGFKGSWLALWLTKLGANVTGVALPPTSPLCTYAAAQVAENEHVESHFCDIRDLSALRQLFGKARPEIVFHLAAQPIVGVSYQDPVTTFETNLMGTVNVLEAIRSQRTVASAVIITSDKCYENVEQIWGYREHDTLGGADPYAASKAAAEMAISAFTRSYFSSDGTPHVASARAGNVVGGGDWSEGRLIPDCIRSLRANEAIKLRNPQATRPWQYVLEPLFGYLTLAKRLFDDGKAFQGPWNFGPAVDNTATVERATRVVVDTWGGGRIESAPSTFHENTLLALDCSKARRHLGWRPVLGFEETMQLTASWYKCQFASGDKSMRECSMNQLENYEKLVNRELST